MTPTVAVAGLVGFIPAQVSWVGVPQTSGGHVVTQLVPRPCWRQTDTWRNPGFSAVLVFVIMVSVIIGRQLRCRASVDGPWSPSGGVRSRVPNARVLSLVRGGE